MAPENMQAIKIVSVGKAEIQTTTLPELRDHFILVKVNAVAINPTDWYGPQKMSQTHVTRLTTLQEAYRL